MHYVIHTDGACAPTNPGPSSYGVVITPGIDGGPSTRLYGFLGHGTNQTAEINAAIKGLQALPANAENEITLYTDSMYVVNGISKWRQGWERKGWRNAEGRPVANQSLWKTLFKEVDARRVTARWVKGHNGDPMNELADELAHTALKVRGSDDPGVRHEASERSTSTIQTQPHTAKGVEPGEAGQGTPTFFPSPDLDRSRFVEMLRDEPGLSCATTPGGVFVDPVVQQRWEGWSMAVQAMTAALELAPRPVSSARNRF